MSASTEELAEMFMQFGRSAQGAISNFNAEMYRAMNGASQPESDTGTR